VPENAATATRETKARFTDFMIIPPYEPDMVKTRTDGPCSGFCALVAQR